MKKITFYKSNGEINSEEQLTNGNLAHIHGMMTKCYLVNGKMAEGFADSFRSSEKNGFDSKVHDYIYLWTWDNLDEHTGKLIGSNEQKYSQTFKKVKIDEIEKVEAIIYSNPRWGGKLTNKFEFNDKKS